MIAILLATYNGEKYLYEQILSIINQSFLNWKLFIHDDGSSDSTINIINHFCTKYEEKIFFLKDIETKRGPAYSFLWLLEHVDADYYMFCDQDDYWLPNKIEISYIKICELESQHKQTPIIVHTDLEVVDENLKTISPSLWEYSKLTKIINKQSLYMIYNTVTGCTMIFNNKVKDLIFPISPLLLMHDSWITQIVVFNNGIVYPIHKQLIKYRQHGNNVLGAGNNKNMFLKMLNLKKSYITNKKIYKLLHQQFNYSFFHYITIKFKYFFICTLRNNT